MLNEIEKQNVPLSVFKFIAFAAIIIGAGFPLVRFFFHLNMEFKSFAERLVHLL